MGGIVAVNRENALVENVRSLAAITALEGNDRASGGLVGYNEGRVRASVSLGTVYSRGTAGGFVGVNALTGTVMNSLSFTDVEYADFSGDTGIFAAENDGLMQGCAYDAANSCKKENIDVGRITVSGVAEKSESAILARDHILYELGFEDSTWQITDGKMPTLHFETLYFDALN